MAAEMHDFNAFSYPVVKFLNSCRHMYVIYLAFALSKYLLNYLLFLEVVDLLSDFSLFGIN